MKTNADKILLIVYSLLALLGSAPDVYFVSGFFVAAAVSAAAYIINKKAVNAVLLSAGIIFLSHFPAMIVFLPLLFYDLANNKLKYLLPLPVILILLRASDYEQLIYLLFGFALAFLLNEKTVVLEKYRNDVKKIRDESAEKNIELNNKNKELMQRENAEIYSATLKERNRIAREIHDNVGHLLSRSILMTGALRAGNKDESTGEALAVLESSLNEAMNSIRESVHDLKDESIDLKMSVELLLKDFTFCPVNFTYDCSSNAPRDVKYCFLAVVKEALANIMKHSHAERADIMIREHPSLYQLVIKDFSSDKGKKFTMAETPADRTGSGIGLSNIKERVEALNGRIQISKDAGFGIYITVPKGGSYESFTDRR